MNKKQTHIEIKELIDTFISNEKRKAGNSIYFRNIIEVCKRFQLEFQKELKSSLNNVFYEELVLSLLEIRYWGMSNTSMNEIYRSSNINTHLKKKMGLFYIKYPNLLGLVGTRNNLIYGIDVVDISSNNLDRFKNIINNDNYSVYVNNKEKTDTNITNNECSSQCYIYNKFLLRQIPLSKIPRNILINQLSYDYENWINIVAQSKNINLNYILNRLQINRNMALMGLSNEEANTKYISNITDTIRRFGKLDHPVGNKFWSHYNNFNIIKYLTPKYNDILLNALGKEECTKIIDEITKYYKLYAYRWLRPFANSSVIDLIDINTLKIFNTSQLRKNQLAFISQFPNKIMEMNNDQIQYIGKRKLLQILQYESNIINKQFLEKIFSVFSNTRFINCVFRRNKKYKLFYFGE